VELDCRSVCRKTGVSSEAEMDVVTGVELEYSYGAGDGRTRSGVASMPKERSGGPRLDRSCDWEKYGYDTSQSMVSTHLGLPPPVPCPHFIIDMILTLGISIHMLWDICHHVSQCRIANECLHTFHQISSPQF